jgi:ferredoxin
LHVVILGAFPYSPNEGRETADIASENTADQRRPTMHAETHKLTPSAFDSAALFNAQTLIDTEACDPMGTCQSDDNETGRSGGASQTPLRFEAARRNDPPQESGAAIGEADPFDPQACDPMGTCQSDDNETGLVGDLEAAVNL